MVANALLKFCVVSIIFIYANCESTLQLVHVIFRHGERTPDVVTLYPKDPYINETYYPYGLGELTNKGKMREYKLGKFIRKRYDSFLGKIYVPDILQAWSSDKNRTKTSLLLVLAGLFPPTEEQIFEVGLNWQPIPFKTLPQNKDPVCIYCGNFRKLLQEIVSSPKIRNEIKQHEETFRYLSDNSGLKVETYDDTFLLYMCLKTQKEFGLELPPWSKKVFPQPLEDYTIKSYNYLTANTQMRRLISGSLIKKIIDDSKNKIQESSLKNLKIVLYSAHELNLASFLKTLEIFEPHIPPYGSFISVELHKINGTAGFKIFYDGYSPGEPRLLKLPACGAFCPLDQFQSLVEEYIPEQDICS